MHARLIFVKFYCGAIEVIPSMIPCKFSIFGCVRDHLAASSLSTTNKHPNYSYLLLLLADLYEEAFSSGNDVIQVLLERGRLNERSSVICVLHAAYNYL